MTSIRRRFGRGYYRGTAGGRSHSMRRNSGARLTNLLLRRCGGVSDWRPRRGRKRQGKRGCWLFWIDHRPFGSVLRTLMAFPPVAGNLDSFRATSCSSACTLGLSIYQWAVTSLIIATNASRLCDRSADTLLAACASVQIREPNTWEPRFSSAAEALIYGPRHWRCVVIVKSTQP